MTSDTAAIAPPLDDLFTSKPELMSTGFAWSSQAKALEPRHALLRAALYIYLFLQAAALLLVVVELSIMWVVKNGAEVTDLPGVPAFAQALVAASPFIVPASYLIFAACVVAYLLFAYRAARNLEISKARGLELSPGAVVWMSFVPFMNLGAIPTAMRQIWRASASPTTGQGEAPSVFVWWWACYLINGGLAGISNVVSRGMETAAPSEAFDRFLPVAVLVMVSATLLTISVFCLLNIIATITRLQRGLASAAVFS